MHRIPILGFAWASVLGVGREIGVIIVVGAAVVVLESVEVLRLIGTAVLVFGLLAACASTNTGGEANPATVETLPAGHSADDARRIAAEAQGALILSLPDDVARLSPEAAEVPAGWKGGSLDLRSLRQLDATTAGRLARWKSSSSYGGVIQLDGLERLDPLAAAELATWADTSGTLSLDGLRQLDQATAERLLAWRGDTLSLGALRRVDAVVLETLDTPAAEALAGWGGSALKLYRPKLSQEARRALQAFKGELTTLDDL